MGRVELVGGLLGWIDAWRRELDTSCESVPFSALREWALIDGSLVHRSGRYFAVTGLRALGPASGSGPAILPVEQPIILQPEIGILGFLVRRERAGEPEILVQAKAEPGNVGGTQIAPTVQATESNYRRVHGGLPTPFLRVFLDQTGARLVRDSLQSEQGTRFLGKYNRNMTVDVTGAGLEPDRPEWRWTIAEELREALAGDYLVNTDARSSLVSGDWNALADSGEAFGRWCGKGGLGEALWQSLRADPDDVIDAMDRIDAWLQSLRKRHAFETQRLPLTDMAGWKVESGRIADDGERQLRVSGYRVCIPNREVAEWDQPLVHSFGRGRCILLCQRREGTLHFMLRASREIGFREFLQLGPSIQQYGAGSLEPTDASSEALREIASSETLSRELLGSWQSDEGGRFHRSVTHYGIREVAEDIDVPDDGLGCWVTLAELVAMTGRKGWLSNEARSVVSPLLSLV